MTPLMQHLRRIRYATFLGDAIILCCLSLVLVWIKKGTAILFFQYGWVMLCVLLALYASKSYEFGMHRSLEKIILSTCAGTIAGYVISIPLILFFPTRLPRIAMIGVIITSLIVIAFFHVLIEWFVRNTTPVEHTLVIGKEEHWADLFKEISEAVSNKIHVIGYINPTPSSIQSFIEKTPHLSTIIVADRDKVDNPELMKVFRQLRDTRNNIFVRYLPSVTESCLGRIPLTMSNKFCQYYEISFNIATPKAYSRALDLFVAGIGLLVALPIMVIIAIFIALTMGFPIIFTQQRIGLYGEPFTIHKFRTMTAKKSNRATFADQDQERITTLGQILRKTRLDELPQLWDVLIGKMALIGPRPEQPEFVKEFIKVIPFYNYRHRIRPGITGWAQVNYSYSASIEETKKKLEYDLYYLKNQSLLLDLQIVLRTIETMLGMRGAR